MQCKKEASFGQYQFLAISKTPPLQNNLHVHQMVKYDIILTKTNVKVKFGSRNHKGDNKLITS